LLTDDVIKRRFDATQQTLDKKKAEAEAAEREKKVLIDSARKENDQTRKEEMNNEATVRDQRARQAKDKMERIQKWEPVPATPVPQREPSLKEETRNQVQSEAREEQEKQKAMEDLLRKPASPNHSQVPATPGGANKADKKR
jgi:hypothetical protein